MKIGSGDNGEFTFLDLISITSFIVALQNLDMNITQDDMQNLQKELSDKTNLLLSEIHSHLENQDNELNKIIKLLEEYKNDDR